MPEDSAKPVIRKEKHVYEVTGKKLGEALGFVGVIIDGCLEPYSYMDGKESKNAYRLKVTTMEKVEIT